MNFSLGNKLVLKRTIANLKRDTLFECVGPQWYSGSISAFDADRSWFELKLAVPERISIS